MTMPLLRSDGLEAYYLSENQEPTHISSGTECRPSAANVPLISSKLRLPEVSDGMVQRRLMELLERSIQNHAGTLIVGRAGSGKTSLAASFAASRSDTSWYSLDASDGDWPTFSRHIRAAILPVGSEDDSGPESSTPLELLADLTAALELHSGAWPTLLVLDGIHHLFDSEWFSEFFQLLIASLPPTAHVLILSRSKPPNPMWRLRSKQVLNVIDEKLLAFSPAESEELFARHGLGKRDAAAAHRECYGRAGMLARILEQKRQAPSRAKPAC